MDRADACAGPRSLRNRRGWHGTSLTEVHATYGASALLRLLLGVAGYLLLHLPVVAATRVLDAAVRRMDAIARHPRPIGHTASNPEAT